MLDKREITTFGNRPLRVVLSGCGAVTRLYAAPALARLALEGLVEVVGIYDPNPSASEAVRNLLPTAAPAATYDALIRSGADLAIIAAPPVFHADQAIAALGEGLSIFCEKPLATRLADADRMLAASATARRILVTGLVRRYFPATRAIKQILEGGVIGSVESVTWFEGGHFDWPVSSPRYFSRATSGGGVLLDIGTHCLDLLSWWFGRPILLSYEDDAMGGVEANCLVHLDYSGIDVRVRLSRDWPRPNRAQLHGSHGALGWTINDPINVDLGLKDAGVLGTLALQDATGTEPNFVECFAMQLADVVEAVRLGRAPAVPAHAGRDVLALIEACYAIRQPMDMPWFSDAERIRAASLTMEAR